MGALEYSNQLIWVFPPPLGDDLMGWEDPGRQNDFLSFL